MKFIYIDDNEAELDLMKENCRENNIDIFCTTRVSDFMKEFEKGEYDIAIVDYRLKLFDGITVINMMQKNNIKTKIFMLTNFDVDFIRTMVRDFEIGIINKKNDFKNILQQMGMGNA